MLWGNDGGHQMDVLKDLERILIEQEEKGRALSRFIALVWIVSIAVDFIAYSMAMNASEYGLRGQARSYLLAYTDILLVYSLGFLASFILSLLIFYSIAKYSRRDILYFLGGFFFLISGFFDLVAMYYTFQSRSKIQEVAVKLPLLSVDSLFKFINDELYYLVNRVNTLTMGSMVTVGGAFVFFGLSAIKFSRILGAQRPLILSSIVQTLETGKEMREGYVQYAVSLYSRELDSAVNNIRMAGILYLIVGVAEILAFLEIVQSILFVIFLIFILGLFLEGSGYKKLRRIIETWKSMQTRSTS
ncbi:MAG: hypothetical protein ACTSX9_05770 [Candidatus Njordarchaeales archaeon]